MSIPVRIVASFEPGISMQLSAAVFGGCRSVRLTLMQIRIIFFSKSHCDILWIKVRTKLFYALVLFLSALGFECAGADNAGMATVKTDSLIVYPAMNDKSDPVKTLKRGDTVTVEVEVNNPDVSWCGIKEAGQADIEGFVSCEGIERLRISARAPCHWAINASFDGDVAGRATVNIPCIGGTAVVSVFTADGTYTNIPAEVYSSENIITLRGSGFHGNVSYNGRAIGKHDGNTYSGSWKVRLLVGGGPRNLSGNWRGIGNYDDICIREKCR